MMHKIPGNDNALFFPDHAFVMCRVVAWMRLMASVYSQLLVIYEEVHGRKF